MSNGRQYLRLLNEMHRAFDFFNDRFANNALKCPIILISPSTGMPLTGWFGIKAWRCNGDEVNEINVCSDWLDRKPEHILETLLHEMAHLKNHQEGHQDCDLETQYHNEWFKTSAETFGLRVKRSLDRGWSETSLGRKALIAIADFEPDLEAFAIFRVDMSVAAQKEN